MAMIAGKGLPPRAALLLAVDFICLIILAPLLFMAPELARTSTLGFAEVTYSLGRLMVAGLLFQALFYYNELYNLKVVRQAPAMLAGALRAFALMLLLVGVTCLGAAQSSVVLSRILTFSCLLFCIAVVARKLALPSRRERALILGCGDATSALREALDYHPEWNLEVVEIVSPSRFNDLVVPDGDPFENYDRVIACGTTPSPPGLLDKLLDWRMRGVAIEDSEAFYERSTGRVCIDELTIEKCIFASPEGKGLRPDAGKRIFDVMAASFLLLLTSPLFLLVALLIWSQRDGRILFKQARKGLHGIPFKIIKFRTMKNAAAGGGAKWALHEVDRITPLGRFLRKYRLDELPQLINILRGEMSLIGPRPEQPELCSLLGEQIPFYEFRHAVMPGLTGWAQVRYHYGSSVEESMRKLEYDLFYVKHASPLLDLAIAIETIKVVLVGRGAI